jgi:hypothetical protein
LQWGFAGFALILLGVVVWMIQQFLSVLRATNEIISANTAAIHENNKMVAAVHTTTHDLRDRILTFKCPMRHEPELQT